jgi:predicted nucleic acid-binding protein
VSGRLLLDTGAFVALVDRSERRHADCVAVLRDWRGPVITTDPVLTETLHLVGPAWHHQHTCLEFFLRGAFILVPASPSTLPHASKLMARYRDVPMDYADATLVVLAEEIGTDQVFTLDRRGFSAYRIHGRRSFAIYP